MQVTNVDIKVPASQVQETHVYIKFYSIFLCLWTMFFPMSLRFQYFTLKKD